MKTFETKLLHTIENIAARADLDVVWLAALPTRAAGCESSGQIRVLDGWHTVFACAYYLFPTRVQFVPIVEVDPGVDVSFTAAYGDEKALGAAIGRFSAEIHEYARARAAADAFEARR